MITVPEYKLIEFGKRGDLDKLKNFIVSKLNIEFKNKFPKKNETALEYNRRKTTYIKSKLKTNFEKYADKVRFVYMKGKSFKSF